MDTAVMKESTLNRVDLLALSPLLRAGLGAPDTALNFRRILEPAPSSTGQTWPTPGSG